MRAVVRRRYGGPERIRVVDVSRPKPSDRGVLVRVRAAGVNPYDLYALRGAPLFVRAVTGWLKPKQSVLGVEYAGVVEQVGKKVTDFVLGDEVFGAHEGAFSEYLVAGESIARKPRSASFEEAAAVPVAAQTALQALRDKGGLREGQSVLVNGASGGVGTFAVQLARLLGASRIGAVCSKNNLALVRSLGADDVIDYTSESLRGTYDLVINTVDSVGPRELRPATAEGGVIVLVAGPMRSVLTARSGGKVRPMTAKHNRTDLETVAQLIDEGKLRTVIDRIYPLEETVEAIRYLETKHVPGKLVVRLD